MTVNLGNFVHSLAADLVARAAALSPAVPIAYATTPRALWRHRADETQATDVYSVLRVSGGPGTTWDAMPRVSLQLWTVGKGGVGPALSRAQTLFELLLDADGRPARMRQIAGLKADGSSDGHWMIVSVDPIQRPSPIGLDANGRDQVSFNFDVGFFKQD